MPKRLTIGNGIQICFREDGRAEYIAGRISPEEVESRVYQWQKEHSEHPDFDFSERWLQAFELAPAPEVGALASLLDLSIEESRKLRPAFKSLVTMLAAVGASQAEAKNAAIDWLRRAIEKQRHRRNPMQS